MQNAQRDELYPAGVVMDAPQTDPPRGRKIKMLKNTPVGDPEGSRIVKIGQ